MSENGTSRSGYIAPPEINRRLSRADELIRVRRKAEARAILVELQHYAMNNPDYWWTVARAARTRRETIDALRHVVKLRPNHEAAWTMLCRLDRTVERPLSPKERHRRDTARKVRHFSRTARILIFALLAAVILTVVAIAVASQSGLLF